MIGLTLNESKCELITSDHEVVLAVRNIVLALLAFLASVFGSADLPLKHDDGYTDGRSQIKGHTDKRTQIHSAQSSLTVIHPSTNRGRRCLTLVNVPLG